VGGHCLGRSAIRATEVERIAVTCLTAEDKDTILALGFVALNRFPVILCFRIHLFGSIWVYS
jgi:hypothetical protein